MLLFVVVLRRPNSQSVFIIESLIKPPLSIALRIFRRAEAALGKNFLELERPAVEAAFTAVMCMWDYFGGMAALGSPSRPAATGLNEEPKI